MDGAMILHPLGNDPAKLVKPLKLLGSATKEGGRGR